MDGRAGDDVIFEAQEGRDALFDPVLDDAAVDFGEVDFLGEVGGEGGGAEEFQLGMVVGDGSGAFDGRHRDLSVWLLDYYDTLWCVPTPSV